MTPPLMAAIPRAVNLLTNALDQAMHMRWMFANS